MNVRISKHCWTLLLASCLITTFGSAFQNAWPSTSTVVRHSKGGTGISTFGNSQPSSIGSSYKSSDAATLVVATSGSTSQPSNTRLSAMTEILTSPEPIHTAFSVATFFPQPFWLLMILIPKSTITKKIMGGLELPLLCCLVHFVIVVSSIVTEGSGVTAPLSEFNDVFNPAGDPQAAFMHMVSSYPNFVAEEWSHVLTWDLFIGRWVWVDGLRRNIFTAHSVLFCNLIGPPGLLLHWLTCTIVGKPIFEPSEKEEIESLE